MSERIKRRENDLEISDFCWEILRRWRVLLVCMLVCALGLSGLQLAKDIKAAKATPEQAAEETEKTIADMENALGVQDMDEVLGAAAIAKQLDEKSNYVKTSELMAINPYEEDVVYLQYLVTGPDVNTNYAEILADYVNTVLNDSELIEVQSGNSVTYINSEGKFITMTSDGSDDSSVVVMARGTDADQATTMAETAKASLEAIAIDGMSASLLQETHTVIADEDLADLQNQVAATIKQLNNNLDSMKSNMTGDQLELYVEYTQYLEDAKSEAAGLASDDDQTLDETNAETTDDDTDTSEASTSKVSFSIKKFLIGAVVGLVIAIIYILLAFLFSAKLRTSEEAKKLYQINILGNVRSGKKGLDLAIVKARYHRSGTLTREEELSLAAANIAVAAGDSKKVYLAMSDGNAVDAELYYDLKKQCQEQGIELFVGKEINYHADALTALAEIGQVVFVESLRQSYYDEMYEEISTCLEQDINVLGMVVIGA